MTAEPSIGINLGMPNRKLAIVVKIAPIARKITVNSDRNLGLAIDGNFTVDKK
jgi:hypothetical protein